ncbi:MAG: sulfate transporter [Gammaproteobacteria bacterium]|nr:sulfate transporter [Gammaproteobacteria bacterium]
MASSSPSTRQRPEGVGTGLQRWAREFSGAFADLGTFLPLIIGVFAVEQMDPTGVLVGFGLFAIAVGLIYRRPIPVQPMKAVAAVVITGGANHSMVAATGLLLGLVLVVLALSGAVGRLARWIPGTVLTGIQLGVGLYLAWAGVRLGLQEPVLGGVAVIGLLVLQRSVLKPVAALIVVAGAALWAGMTSDALLPEPVLGVSFPQLILPDQQSLWMASQTLLLPQLVLTLTNAALITATIAADLFPLERKPITPGRLAFTSGLLNVILASLGAFPMCHGAGGLVVQYKFGARTGLAPVIFGITCLAFGVFLGNDDLAIVSLLPLAAICALLVIAGADLAFGKHLLEVRHDRLAVILLTGISCAVLNVAAGLLIGLLTEWIRRVLAPERSQV